MILTACNQREPAHIEDPEDEIPPKEAQSDFLDIGKQAGIEWLSFVPNAERKYPSLYQGLDRDQKRRLWLAPMEKPDERVLLQFDLPPGSKIWPVEWYGKELMAIELPGVTDISLAIAVAGDPGASISGKIANARSGHPRKGDFDDGTGGIRNVSESDGIATLSKPVNGYIAGAYGDRVLSWRSQHLRVVVESLQGLESVEAVRTVLAGISVSRDLGLEGLPTHKCSSSVDDLKNGVLRFPGGTLNLPLKEGQVARKVGGDSTIQIDGHGAKPWMLIRRLAESSAPGDLRARVRNDAVFSRRLKDPGAKFSAGYAPDSALPMVLWDYSNTGTEQVVVGILKSGKELLTVEVVSTGLRDGEARRKARADALALLVAITGDESTTAPEMEPLVGWNVGTMGRDD